MQILLCPDSIEVNFFMSNLKIGPIRGGLYVPHLNFELACVAISEVLSVTVRISLFTLLLVLLLS